MTGPDPGSGPVHTHDGEDHTHDGEDHTHDHEGATTPAQWLRHLLAPHSHDPADAVDDALEASDEGIRALKVSLVGLGVTAVVQLVIVALSGSVALLADTVHNFSDALTAIPLWLAFALGRRAADDRYTYGYGRAEDLAGLFVVGMIALSAVVAGWESIQRLTDPSDLRNVGWVIAAGVVGAAGNELVALYRIRVGRRIGSAALVADGLHARTDGLTSLAVAAGGVGVALGYPVADPIVGLLITVAILRVLWQAAGDVFGRLLDRVDPALVERIRTAAGDVDGVGRVDTVTVRWLGNRLRAELDVAVDDGLSVVQGHRIATGVHHRLLHEIPRLAHAVVHVHPLRAGRDHHRSLEGHPPMDGSDG